MLEVTTKVEWEFRMQDRGNILVIKIFVSEDPFSMFGGARKSGSFKSQACIPPVSRTAKLFRSIPRRRIWRKIFGAGLPEISMQNREASGTSNGTDGHEAGLRYNR